MRLHRQYGEGLKELRAPLESGKLQQTYYYDPAMNGASGNSVVINGYTFDISSWKSFPLGVVSGLQYSNDTWGKCFYAMVDTVNFADIFEQDF